MVLLAVRLLPSQTSAIVDDPDSDTPSYSRKLAESVPPQVNPQRSVAHSSTPLRPADPSVHSQVSTSPPWSSVRLPSLPDASPRVY